MREQEGGEARRGGGRGNALINIDGLCSFKDWVQHEANAPATVLASMSYMAPVRSTHVGKMLRSEPVLEVMGRNLYVEQGTGRAPTHLGSKEAHVCVKKY